MAIEQEHICPIDTRVEFKTLTGLAAGGANGVGKPPKGPRPAVTPPLEEIWLSGYADNPYPELRLL